VNAVPAPAAVPIHSADAKSLGPLETTMPDQLLAEDVVALSREPVLVLDDHLTVVAASRSFYDSFGTERANVIGLPFAQVANGRLEHPSLADEVRRAHSERRPLRDVEARLDTPAGSRTFLLHADPIDRRTGTGGRILLTVQEVTEQRRVEADCEEAIVRANNMLVELNHRVMNSFAMIGAILTMEGRAQPDDTCRAAFDRMRSRITSIAHLYRNLGRESAPEVVPADAYLQNIVNDLITSLSDPGRKIETSYAITKIMLPTRTAVPVGLIVNEVVTNCLKYAFAERTHGLIEVEFTRANTDQILRISDNGVGMNPSAHMASGLGRRLSEAFAKQLHGTVEYVSGPRGTTVILRFPEQAPR
jgi:two-component sensor histidine kinase